MYLKKFSVILCLVLLITAYASAQTPAKFKIIKTDEFEGAIIAKEQVPQLRYFDEKRNAYWTPTEQEVLEAEKLSKAYLEKYNSDNQYYKTSIPNILGRWRNYKRQYIGLIEENGEKAIWINYFHDDGHFSYWNETLVLVYDGGSAFFQIKVNLNKKECYDLSINGVA